MKIYYNNTEEDVIASDSSYRFQEIMGDNLISLEFRLPYYIDFPIGSTIVYQNRTYTMYEIGQFTKVNDREYSYVLTFHTEQKSLERYKFRNHIDRRLKFTLTAKPKEYIKHICENLKERTGKEWLVGDCLECSEKTQSFSHNSILDALNSIASLFETEWEIRGNTINLRKVEYNKENPLNLSYGKGNGFKSGIQRTLSGETAVDVLFCEGGDRNIDQSKYTYYNEDINGQVQLYHADTLRLPKKESIFYIPPTESLIENPDDKDYGTLYLWQEFQNLSNDRKAEVLRKCECYITDGDGYELRRARFDGTKMVEHFINNGYEDSADFTEIYPKRVGTISEVKCINREKHFYNFVDKDCDVDYSDKKTWHSGANVTIIFQDGMLEGKEFNLSKYTHVLQGKDVREFEIQPAELDSIIMPDEETHYVPVVGNHYAIFHINLPEKYIKDAEREMALQGCFYMHKHSESEIEFQGSVDGIWAKKNWVEIGPKIGLGYYVNFTDEAICQDGKKMRITAVKDNLNRPHSPELTLSNTTIAQGISSQLKKIPQNEVYTEHQFTESVNFAKRTFRDSKETIDALNEAFRGNYTEGINPTTVKTMMALIGDESLQYEFGLPTESQGYVTEFRTYTFEPQFSDGKLIVGTNRYMRHLAYTTENKMVSSTAWVNYPYWRIDGTENDNIGYFDISAEDSDKFFYLYAKVSRNALLSQNIGKIDTSGNRWVLSSEPIQDEASSEWMNLLVGVLNSEYGGGRSFASVYGKTEITGGRIRTDVIASNDGETYFDLKHNIICGRINFKSGLISKEIFVGSSEEEATAGFGGDYLFFAGNTSKEGTHYAQMNLYGVMEFNDDYGDMIMLVNPRLSEVWVRSATIKNLISEDFKSKSFNPNVTITNSGGIVSKTPITAYTTRYGDTPICSTLAIIVWQGKFLYYDSKGYVKVTEYKAEGFDFNFTRLAEGCISIQFEKEFTSYLDYFVSAIGLSRDGYSVGKPCQAYASIEESSREKSGFILTISDDDSCNDYDIHVTIWAKC